MPAGFYTPSSEIEPIVGIQLCVFSPDEIEKRSVVEITNAGTYEGNEPKIGGLFDPRMGVIDNGKECRSCGQTNHKCPGHFGHFRLARPVYYIQFLPFILNILSCICIRCSKLRIDKKYRSHFLKRKGEVRWREVLAASKEIHRCGQETEDGCGALQPTRFVREGIARIMAEWDDDASGSRSGKQTQILEVEYVLRLFRKILDEDVDFIGLNRYWCRPDWMICTVLPIPPPQVRPSVIQDNNQRSEDDLTHKLAEIVKTNNTYLQPKIDANAAKSVIDEWTNVLQYHIATLVDNQIPGVAPSAQRNGRPLKSIQQRLGSKEGRIRYNIQGKRVEFSARSVITPDPNISIAELGVPEKIAMNLTRPERVTIFNRNKLYRLIQNGPLKYPGAKTIRRADGRIISLRHVNTKEIVLNLGDIVNRHLMDNDPILFNRQPTLHRMSMMAHRVKVLTGKTFRLNVSVTAPYNADFDGDEMNAHAPQSIEAATELEEIAAVPHQILRPRDGLPVIGIVQDTLVGSYRLTRDSVQFNNREFMNMMMWNKRFTGVLPAPKKDALHWSGQQVISQLLPPINLDMMNGGKKKVVIREGDVLEGQFDKGIFSKASKGIIHMTYNDYGSKDTVQLIDSLQNTVAQFLIYDGFSVGISDLIADAATKKEMTAKIQEKKAQIETVLLEVHQDLFDNNTGKTNQSEFEDRAFGLLNKAMESAGEIGQNTLSTENRMIAMVRAGSKGGPINIAQMIACVGQQNIEGKRIPYGFEDRTLPHFKKYDDGAEARGFIENSFISGLTPTEFFFHAMSGREGLIDTAVKTADTGYIQRQIVKAMEDLVVQQDGTVRDANMNITQFQYGEDGINSTKIESQPLPLSTMTDDEIEKEFGLKGVDLSEVMGVPRGDDAAVLAEYTAQVFADRKMIVEEIFRSGRQGSIYSPVNLERLILNIKIKFGLRPEQKTNLTPATILKGIESVLKKTQGYHAIWAALLRFYLSPTKLILQDRFTESAFDTLCEVLVTKNWQAWVQPGEHVGIIAAQSIGEPSTQMSCQRHTFVQISKNGGNHVGAMGEFIDKMLSEHAKDVVTIGENSVVLDLAEDYYIMGVSDDEKTSWKRVSQVSRHPANGGLVKVTTKSGRTTTATLTHSFLKRTEKGIAPILGSELAVGMRIPIATKVDQVPLSLITSHSGFTLNKDFGWLCGIYLADGCFMSNTVSISKIHPVVEESIRNTASKYGWRITVRNYQGEYGPAKSTNIHSKELKDFLMAEFSTGSYGKKIGPITYSAPREFQEGLLSGYFDGDGNVNAARHQIRAGSRSKDLIRHVNRLLSYCGFFSVMSEETSVQIPDKTMYTVNVLKKYAAEFKERIGFRLEEKAAALDEIIAYMDREDKHDTKELYDKIPEVGRQIALVGKALELPGQSRLYGRWAKKESVGRQTLQAYIKIFEASTTADTPKEVLDTIAALRSAAYSNVIWDEIVSLDYLDDPKEYVYDFTVPGNDSFMVDDAILVHNTLNSVDWDTRIMIAKNGQIVCPQIGEFIDKHLAANPGKIQEFGSQEYLPLDDGNEWKAISCDENGTMMWTKLEAITRHPVVNEDGSNTILEVTLASGRTVKATKGLSFLTKDGDKVVGIKGSDLKVGDLTPIANSLVIGEIGYTETLAVREHLPPTEWLYGTDVSQIPDTIPLTESFGFFVGAYLAEGMANTTQVNITNNDKAYLDKVQALMTSWNVGTHMICEERSCEKSGISGTTTSLVIHSTLLAALMQKLFGRVSHEKTMPDWVFQAPDTFIQGLVDGYISGDGTIEKKTGCVKATSVSKDLMTRVGTLLARFGIFSTVSERTPEKGVFDSVRTNYTLYVPIKYSKVFAKTFTLSHMAKQSSLVYHFTDSYEPKCRRSTTGDVIWDTVASIKEVTPIKGKVYDVTVEGTRNFMTSSCHVKRDTFHLAGVASKSNVTRGVPRLKELLKVTQNPKAVSLTIHLKPEYRNSKEKAREVAQDLELTLLRDMAVKTAIYYDPSDSNTVLKEDQDLLAFYKLFEISSSTSDTVVAAEEESLWSKWILRLELNREKMFDKNVTMEDILFVLRRLFDTNIRMVYSDFNSQKLVMRIRLTLKSMDDGKSDPSSLDALSAYKKFQNKLLNSVIIRGFPGIKAVTFRKGDERFIFDEKEKKYVAKEEYILDTDGSNFVEAMNHPAVDGSRLYSTHVHDVLGHLGIEATRQILYNEIQTLFEDGQINYRHLGLLVDVMTRAGRLMSVDRYGINKLDIGPLAKASFEETERILLKAAVFGEIDPITGVSANIMTGQPMRGGTTFSDILLDEGAFMSLQKNMPEPPVIEKDEDARMAMEAAAEAAEDDLCSPSRLKMNMTLPSKGKLLDEDDIEFAEVDDDGSI